MADLAKKIIEILRDKTRQDGDEFVALHEPVFLGKEDVYLKDCISSGWVSSVGKYVDRFENELASFCGAERAIAVVNGTSALHVCLILAGVTRDTEVLIPSFTFVATANAVSYCGAIPHFVDIQERNLGVDADKLENYLDEIGEFKDGKLFNKITGRRIAAIVPMHAYGHPVDLNGLKYIADRYELPLIEDAAESLGSYYKGSHTGNYGLLSAMSFNGNKTITTGGGGAILTNDQGLADKAKHLTTTAKIAHPWEIKHDMIGYNYRMPNINAALGVAQLEELPEILKVKRSLAEQYNAAFREINELDFLWEEVGNISNFWLNTVILDKHKSDQLEKIIIETNKNNFMTRPAWTLLHTLKPYESCPRMPLDCSESMSKRIINLPSGYKVRSLL